jgi:hypothetical protein
VTAVAVWHHRPTADELLEARVAAGWRPTPTAMRDGDVVLGHAACLLTRPGGPADTRP